MSKKLFIAGSGDQDDFERVASVISNIIFDLDFQIIITTTEQEKNTFDEYLLKEFDQRSSGKETKILYYESTLYNPYETGVTSRYKNIKFIRHRIDGSRQRVLMNAIQDSSCVLLLGGMVTVELIGQLSTLLSKPMIPLPWIDHSKEDINKKSSSFSLWREHGGSFDAESSSFIDNVTTVDIDEKNEDFSKFKDGFIKLLRKLTTPRFNPFAKETKRGKLSAALLLLTVLIGLTGWFLLYSKGSNVMDYQARMRFAFSCIPIVFSSGPS